MLVVKIYFNSKIASTSTATPNGRLFELTAALACMPILPKILTIVSEAPLITFGCSVKSSTEFTNPVNFMHDLILSKSLLRNFLAWETILKAHLAAALYPSSVVKSLPSLPLINSPFSLIEIWPDIKRRLLDILTA